MRRTTSAFTEPWPASTPPVNEWTFYGANGEKLGVYQLVQGTDNYGNAYAYFAPVRTSVWFGGKLVYENGPVNLDRLGTNHAQNAQFLPYGDEITSTSNDRTKFATYTRDSYTGLDYADQRFYASTYGRFMTPDPYVAGGAAKGSVSNPKDPGSWNRYAYTRGDPVNRLDPRGRDDCPPGVDFCTTVTATQGYDTSGPGGPTGTSNYYYSELTQFYDAQAAEDVAQSQAQSQ